jgi:hypothetical protein
MCMGHNSFTHHTFATLHLWIPYITSHGNIDLCPTYLRTLGTPSPLSSRATMRGVTNPFDDD